MYFMLCEVPAPKTALRLSSSLAPYSAQLSIILIHWADAVLAHSASHVAHLRGERNSIKAITHKMAAIHLVNDYLSDPVKAVSDEAFSAVLRLLTFEVL